jgi:alkylation response protein AidB-like acyl-CoA dehydrogenase
MAVLTEDQAMLRDMAAAWARERAPIACARRAWEGAYPAGFDPELYAEMAAMGWTGMVTPEAYGGAEFGCLGMGLVAEELGRTLAPTPLLASALTGVSLIDRAGSEVQKQAWLPRIASGEVVATLALEEGPRHDPAMVSLKAEPAGTGWRLNGAKRPVDEGMGADLAVVVARTSGVAGDTEGLSLFLLETSADRLVRQPLRQIDGRGAAAFTFDGVEVGAEALMGEVGRAWPALEQALDRTRAVLAAEMLGSSLQAFEITLEHLKTRVQFGRVIGEFQALQHRAAAMFGELELTRSAVEAALQALDAGDADAPRLVSLAKAMAGETFRQVANEMVQMHGGIGMTEEHDAGLYLKRARAADVAFGGAAYHRERWGRLSGF